MDYILRFGAEVDDVDDPTLQPIFHPLHGLIKLHSFPHSQLLPPTIKHSSLLGLSAGGGGSENNLGFRARRKRWGVETVHLGIDGGVGERRTEPAPEVARMVSTSTPNTTSAGSEGIDRPSVNVSVDVETQKTEMNTTIQGTGTESKPVKKEKRARVRFGDDEIMNESIPSKQDTGPGHDHGDHPGHGGHGHSHTHTPRATVRHDRPDLYEF